MLSHLQIRNLAVLDEVDLEFASGLTVFTGETGAGKSMLVDALALALGARADAAVVRPGAQRAEIIATFDIAGRADIAAWLRDRDLDATPECQLRRIVTSEGRSRGYLNGQSVPLEALRELGEQLVEICGQHAHQSLRHRSAQRALLDGHGGHEALLAATAAAHAAWKTAESARRACEVRGEDREARCELLSHQLRELEALNLQPGEIAILEGEQRLLANRERIATGLGAALLRLYDAEHSAAQDDVAASRRELELLGDLDSGLVAVAALLEQAQIQIAEAAETIRHRLASLEHDPARQEHIEARLSAAYELSRKHRVPVEELPARARDLAAELQRLSDGQTRLAELAAEAAERRQSLVRAAAALSRARLKAARSMARDVTTRLHQLGMPDARFEVRVQPLPDEELGASGADEVEFLVTTNPGIDPGPVSRVASGGELSRLSLAIQVVAMAAHGTPTLIFDEVDAGVGGRVAEIVGQSLKSLSSGRQVLCVTHLPQVASQADRHLGLSKHSDGAHTRTEVRLLTGRERVEEIARMLGGLRITDKTRAHAGEMLAMAGERRAC